MDDIQQELIALKNEIRDLKTAQAIPSKLKTYWKAVVIPAGTYSGVYTWTIQYADQDTENEPLVYVQNDMNVLPLRSDNTQLIEWTTLSVTYYSQGLFIVYSSKPIYDINSNF